MNYRDSARQIVANAVNIPAVGLDNDTSIETLASWDSIAHINIMLAIEEALGDQMEPETMIQATSVGTIAAILENRGNIGR